MVAYPSGLYWLWMVLYLSTSRHELSNDYSLTVLLPAIHLSMKIDIEKVLTWMTTNSEKLAIAQAQCDHLNDYKKVILAQEMQKSTATSSAAQEKDALCTENYKNHLEVTQTAETEYLRLKYLMNTAQAKVDCWRSLNASHRAEGKNIL